jgi:hypothetical protein
MSSETVGSKKTPIFFSDEALDVIDDLCKGMVVPSRGNVVRAALGVLKAVNAHVQAGDTILVERGDGTLTEVKFPFLSK